MTKIKSLFISLVLTLGVSTAIAGSHGSTHDLVKERGKLMCGSNTGLAGFGAPNDAGVDISKLMNKTSAIWQKMNEKK